MAPALLLYAVFAAPVYVMLLVGTVYEGGMFGRGWIGLEAFREVFASQRFWQSVRVTLRYVAWNTPLVMLAGVAIAVVIGTLRKRARGYLRMAYYVPTVVSPVAVSVIWRWLLNPRGALNQLLGTQTLWIAQEPHAFHAINLMLLVAVLGLQVLWISAALSAVDPEVYEAARIDGCNLAQETWFITAPVVAPILVYMSALRAAGAMQLWMFPYALTGGGPNRSTMTTMLLIYREATQHSRLPQAMVMSLFLVVVMALGLAVVSKLSRGRLV